MSHDDYAKPATAMTAAEINKKNEALWGNIGPATSAAPTVAKELRSVPVYTGGGVGDGDDSTFEERETQKALNPKKYPNSMAGVKRISKGTGKSVSKIKSEINNKRAGESKDEVQPTQSAPEDPRSDNLLTTEDDLVEGSEAMEHDAVSPESIAKQIKTPSKMRAHNVNIMNERLSQATSEADRRKLAANLKTPSKMRAHNVNIMNERLAQAEKKGK